MCGASGSQTHYHCATETSLGTKPYYSIRSTQFPLHIWPLSKYKRPSELDTQAKPRPAYAISYGHSLFQT